MSRVCPYTECKHDHYEFGWLDEILFLKLGLDLTVKGTQQPVVPFSDLHEARAEIIAQYEGFSSHPSNSKSKDTPCDHVEYKPTGICVKCGWHRALPEPPQDTSLDWLERIAKFTDDYVDELNNEETHGDITGLHQIQDELISEIQAWHKAEIAKLLQVIEDEAEVYNIKSRNGEIVEPNTGVMAVPLEALKQIKDNVINGGSL